MNSRLEGVAPLRREVRLRALEAANRVALPAPNPRRRVSLPRALEARIYPPADRSRKTSPCKLPPPPWMTPRNSA
jgi:hypothetical protein